MPSAYIALGANLGQPSVQVRCAIDTINALPHSRVLQRSRLYKTPPWGVTEQPSFVNAVAHIETELTPQNLLRALLDIERDLGRERSGERWGPRVLDLDLLLYDDRVLREDHLILPHPRIADRAFVLLPLADLAPDLIIPGQGRVADLLSRVDTQGCEPLPDASLSHGDSLRL